MNQASDAGKLAVELQKVASRLLRNAFKQVDDDDERKNYPTLARIVRRIEGEERWRDNPNQAALKIVQKAIGSLPKAMSGRGPRKVGGQNHLWQGRPERQLAELLYGYRNNEVPLRFHKDGSEAPRTYKYDYRPAAIALANLEADETSEKRMIRVIREDLADKLLAMERNAIEQQARSDDVGDSEQAKQSAFVDSEAVPYVPRPAEEAALKAWLGSDGRLAVLAGDSGNGKSRLAREVLTAFDHATGTQSIRIDAVSSYTLFDSLRRWLDDTSIDGLVELRFKFIAAMQAQSAVTLILVDNVSQWADVEMLVNAAPRCLITAESDVVPADVLHHVVEIPPLGPTESEKLVRSFRPHAAIDDILWLSRAAGGKPRFLVDCLGMFTEAEMSIKDIYDCIYSYQSDIIATVGKGSRSIDKVYLRYYETLSDSMRLLVDVLAHLNVPTLALDVVAQVYRSATNLEGATVADSASDFRLCVMTLKQRYLIEFQGDVIYGHTLTMSIFRSFAKQRRQNILSAFVNCYLDAAEVVESLLSTRTLEWVPGLVHSLLGLSTTELLAALVRRAPASADADQKDNHAKTYFNELLTYTRVGCKQLGIPEATLAVYRNLIADPAYFDRGLGNAAQFMAIVADNFQSGLLSRQAFGAQLNELIADDFTTNKTILMQTRWRAARIDYEYYRSVEESMPILGPMFESLENRSNVRFDPSELYHELIHSCESLEHLGTTTEAFLCCETLLQNHDVLDLPLLAQLRIAILGCRASSKVLAIDACERIFNTASKHSQELLGRTASVVVEAYARLAEAWVCRARSVLEGGSQREAIELFFAASERFVKVGDVRGSLEAELEGLTLIYWNVFNDFELIQPGGLDPHDYYRWLHRVADSLGERHVVNRLRLLEILREVWLHPRLTHIAYAAELAYDSAMRYEDARTYMQATLVINAVDHQLGLRSTDNRTRWRWVSLFEIMNLSRPSLERERFGEMLAMMMADPRTILTL